MVYSKLITYYLSFTAFYYLSVFLRSLDYCGNPIRVHYWASLINPTFSDVTSVGGNQPWWECVHHRNWQNLLDSLLNHSGLDYVSGLDLLFCWLSRLQKVMEEMLILQIKLRKYVMCITVKLWVSGKFKMYPSSIWKYYLTW